MSGRNTSETCLAGSLGSRRGRPTLGSRYGRTPLADDRVEAQGVVFADSAALGRLPV
jgi:hypothetical protein